MRTCAMRMEKPDCSEVYSDKQEEICDGERGQSRSPFKKEAAEARELLPKHGGLEQAGSEGQGPGGVQGWPFPLSRE